MLFKTGFSAHFPPNQIKMRAELLLLLFALIAVVVPVLNRYFCNVALHNVKLSFALGNNARVLL